MPNDVLEPNPLGVLTNEEILVFAIGRSLPLPPGVPGQAAADVDPAALRASFALAARTLVSRGVLPQPISAAESADSAMGDALATLCSPALRFTMTFGEGKRAAVRDFVTGPAGVFGRIPDQLGLNLVYQLPRDALLKTLLACAGIDGEGETGPGTVITIDTEHLRQALTGGVDTVTSLVSSALKTVSADMTPARSLAQGLTGSGESGLARFSARKDEKVCLFAVGWQYTSAGVWLLDTPLDGDARSAPKLSLSQLGSAGLAERITEGFTTVAEFAGSVA